MSERSLRQSYYAIIRAVAAADEAALDRLIAEDMVDHNAVPGQAPGRVGIKYWMTMMHDVFADLTGVVEDTVVEGDKIAARVTWHGIHRGDFVGVPGTGTPVTMQSVQILRFADGMASEWWGTADVFGVLRQIGARVAALTQLEAADLFVPKHLGRASLDDLAGRQASWTRYRYPVVFGPVVTHLVTHRSVMAHTSRVPS